MYATKTFSATDLPRIGQRVRTATVATVRGTNVPTGTLCDVTGYGAHPDLVMLAVYRRNPDGTVDIMTDVPASAMNLESVRGKPFVAGVDDRRREGTNPASAPATHGVAVAAPPARSARTKAAEASESPADAEAALDILRDALRRPATDPKLAERLDATELRIDALGEVTGALSVRIDQQTHALSDVRASMTAMHTLTAETVLSLDAKVTALADALASAPATVVARAAVAAASATGKEPILGAISRFYTPHVETPFNVLLCTAPSLGKSYAIRRLGKLYDVYLEHGCADDVDEIPTLLGSPIPDGHGSFLIVDGVMVEAMRAAASGQSVLLLLDEVLREPQRVQEWLLTFLTGVETPTGKIYRLRTRRANGDGTLEVIEAPAANLHIIGATNLGAIPPIEAFWSRWYKVRVDFSLDVVREVASAICDAHAITDSADLVASFADIVMQSREAVKNNRLRFPVDLRTLVYGCKAAPEATGKSVGAFVGESLAAQTAHWDIDTGDMAPESVSQCDDWASTLKAL